MIAKQTLPSLLSSSSVINNWRILRPCTQLDPQLGDMKTNTGGCCQPWPKKKICCVSCSVFSLVVSIGIILSLMNKVFIKMHKFIFLIILSSSVIVGLVLSVYLKPSLTHQDSDAWDEKLSEYSQNNFTIVSIIPKSTIIFYRREGLKKSGNFHTFSG